ncbi:MAG: Cys regulon transcriptional activator [Candidatus Accumulibacter regalis]|jgi:LysR family cys regulon transcriptional activator|uniref:Cys regulon transcriptional activator n=1 Tax=Accumulibacter regalis TaxID=522306 RepID=A0A011PCU7_ACCRE|nr:MULTISPECIES: CysB family HTH-type transcriptional regulator [unclassified Candidatus Accumulibacter]EXI85401.1 MAG: Cys regulon transcriptional activator [Candidatus Accumulibacter regalis]MQM33613.1 CysB family HTH-type transcriptional regulator [Candidatus Accumulibacter phosphatis]MBL8368812.1 CysB family HTH-type transcriptional regulator [Accumulibacter sp.]MBN8514711.1 CysB family HTH-type transcriptional regulator [Accumulibacter sp.]MBO3703496.1 CysB family HTH-type transcriptional
MKLQQLRYLVEVAQRGLNVSEAAAALYTSQPGISKQIKLLEDELGVIVFERSGKRLTAVTEPGRAVLEIAERILRDAENIRRVGEEYAGGDSGSLVIATTHTQARYALPGVVKQFVERHPRVRLSLRQGHPTQIAEWALKGEADIAIATEALDQYPQLLMLPCYQWVHCVIAPDGHAILGEKSLSLTALARWPLITYDSAFAGRSRINKAFELAQLTPNVVLTAIDADVIKTYVSLGLGLGIIASMAFDAARDAGLQALPAEHLFGSNTTRIGLRRGNHIRRYEYEFIELFAPQLTRKAVDMAIAGARPDAEYQL